MDENYGNQRKISNVDSGVFLFISTKLDFHEVL